MLNEILTVRKGTKLIVNGNSVKICQSCAMPMSKDPQGGGTNQREKGMGSTLLFHLKGLSNKPILVGTWRSAVWAIKFYLKNGFTLVSSEEKNILLKTYWNISDRQIETSVVLCDSKWLKTKQFERQQNNRKREFDRKN